MRSVALIFSLLIISISAFSQGTLKSDSVFQKTQKPLRFMVFGDWGRNGEDRQKEVALEMGKVAKKFKPEFIVSTGDNFYPNGVQSTRDHNWLASYEDITPPIPCNPTGMLSWETMITGEIPRQK